MYVSNLYNKLAPGVSHMTVLRNGSRTVEKSEHTHTSVSTKRTVSSTYHTEHTVKHVKKGYDEREPVRYVTTTSTTVKEPPIQHSAITTVVSMEFTGIAQTKQAFKLLRGREHNRLMSYFGPIFCFAEKCRNFWTWPSI